MIPYLLFSAAVFSAGAYGVLARRNLLLVLMSLELMLNGVNVALVAFAAKHAATAPEAGQVLVLIVMAVAAAEVSIGLAIVIAIFRTRQTVDVRDLEALSG